MYFTGWILLAYINRGVAYVDQGRYEEAIADYNAAIRLDPANASTSAVAYYNRGIAYAGQGRYEEARMDYERALELTSNDHVRQAAQQKLEELEKLADH